MMIPGNKAARNLSPVSCFSFFLLAIIPLLFLFFFFCGVVLDGPHCLGFEVVLSMF